MATRKAINYKLIMIVNAINHCNDKGISLKDKEVIRERLA
jgi:hypothetical protein